MNEHILPWDCKAFTLLVVLYPILHLYGIGLPNVSVADVMLAVFIAYDLTRMVGTRELHLYPEWIPFAVYVLFAVMLGDASSEMLAGLRFLAYLYSVAWLTPNYFDFSYGIVVLEKAVIAASAWAIVQAIGIYAFGRYIPGTLNFLPIMREDLLTYGEGYRSGVLRVRSFFGEPAHFAAYVLLYIQLVLDVYGVSKRRRRLVLAVAALVFSVSNLGYIGLAWVWFVYFASRLTSAAKTGVVDVRGLLGGIASALTLPAFLAWFTNTEVFATFVRRIDPEGGSVRGRLDGYYVFQPGVVGDQAIRVFGHGFDDSQVIHYLPSIPLFYWRFGYLGTALFFLAVLISLSRNRERAGLHVVLLFILLGIGSELFASYLLILFMAFVNTCCTDKGIQ